MYSTGGKVSGRDAFAKSHTPAHNLHPADSQLKLEKSVCEHFHCPFNEKNYFQNSATEADLYFLRDFERLPPYKTPRMRPRCRHQFDGVQTGLACSGNTPALQATGALRQRLNLIGT
jgi:hypothetical protein